MRKLACIILILTIALSTMFLIENTRAYNVSGPINYNTTWYKSNSPYVLTGNVVIGTGVTLTIEPGVIVELGSYHIEVRGTLNARGTSSQKITFTSNGYFNQKIDFTSTSTSSCIIDYATIYSVSMVNDGGSPRISNTYFISSNLPPITSNSGSPTITNNVINLHSTNGIYLVSGSAVISANTIKGENQYYGIYINTYASATILNNNITNCLAGINVIGYADIRQNNIMDNINDGIVSSSALTPNIQNNVLANNNCGISGTGNIVGNTIAENGLAGIWSPSATALITDNNIFDNTENLHMTAKVNVSATGNWWGSSDELIIGQTIWDYKDDPSNVGNVTFSPFRSERNPAAPAIPTIIPIPTPSPTPSPTITILTPTPTTPPTQQPQNTQQPTSTPLPYKVNQPTPTPTQSPTRLPVQPRETPYSSGETGSIDTTSIVLVVLAIVAMLLVVVFLSKRFSKK